MLTENWDRVKQHKWLYIGTTTRRWPTLRVGSQSTRKPAQNIQDSQLIFKMTVRIATLNLCLGLKNKKDLVKSALLEHKIDILCMQEKKLFIN